MKVQSLRTKMPSKITLTDAIYLTMRDGKWWTFWDLQRVIKEKTGSFYGEPTISAGIRNLRKDDYRAKYGLPYEGDTVERRRKHGSKGYEYKLIGVKNG